MEWNLTYLIVHLAALSGAVILVRHTPDFLQRMLIVLLIVSGVVYLTADVWALAGEERVWPVRLLASRFEHTAVLLYLLRQVWIKTNICQSLKSSNYQAMSKS